MKRIVPILVLFALPAFAEDTRQFVELKPAARETLRQEMFDNLLALNEILGLVGVGKLKEAAAVAEEKLGKTAMGKNARLPFDARPGPQMPVDMHNIGRDGHAAASEFAAAAASGNREQALVKLSQLTGTCVACHASYRTH